MKSQQPNLKPSCATTIQRSITFFMELVGFSDEYISLQSGIPLQRIASFRSKNYSGKEPTIEEIISLGRALGVEPMLLS
jgi:hypothetical protein